LPEGQGIEPGKGLAVLIRILLPVRVSGQSQLFDDLTNVPLRCAWMQPVGNVEIWQS